MLPAPPSDRPRRSVRPPTRYGLIDPRDLEQSADEHSYSALSVELDEYIEKHGTSDSAYDLSPDDSNTYGTICVDEEDAINALHVDTNESDERQQDGSHDPDPLTHREAMRSKHRRDWQAAEDSEMLSLLSKQVFKVVDRTRGMRTMKTKWVYKTKRDSEGRVTKHKARLVAKGFLQRYGIDYTETFSPVARFSSIRTVIALAVQLGLEVKQIDFETAYLNAPVEERLYLEQPEGACIGDGSKVLMLTRALYGLKQAGRNWNHTLCDLLIKLGYEQSTVDQCIFFKRVPGLPPIIVAVYVDDMIAAVHPDAAHIWAADKADIHATFPIQDLGTCQFMLGTKIDRSDDGSTITLSQPAYLTSLLQNFRMENCKPVPTPGIGDLDARIYSEDSALLSTDEHERYRSIVGAVLYAANCTRPDICHVVSLLSRFVSCPRQVHLAAAFHLLRYIRGTIDYALVYRRSDTDDLTIKVYTDAAFADCKDTRRSTTGMMTFLSGCMVSWHSHRQKLVTLSSTESELVALSFGMQEVIHLKKWLAEIDLPASSATLACDNQAAIILAQSEKDHPRLKHVDVRLCMIRNMVSYHGVVLTWVPTEDQLADLMTKILGRVKLRSFISRIFSTLSPSDD